MTKSIDAAPSTLTPRQQMFVEEYLRSWNATAAARAAGYSEATAYSQGHRLLKSAEIAQAIARRIEEVAMSADEVLLRLAAIARGSLAPFLRFEEGGGVQIDLASDEARANLHLLKKLKPSARGGGAVEVELHDALRALELLGKHHKLFTDRIEHSGQVVVGVVRVPPKMSPEEWHQQACGSSTCSPETDRD